MPAFPRLIAFDLDYTLWDLWVDTHVTAPFKRPSPPDDLNIVLPRRGQPISFYPDVPEILHRIERHNTNVNASSSPTSTSPDSPTSTTAPSKKTARKAARSSSSVVEQGGAFDEGTVGEECTVAICSRTSAPEYAREVLGLLLVPPPKDDGEQEPRKALEFFDQKEIYPGSKIKHFKQLHKKTGIPYEEMLFFDDEARNKEVESLGVTMILVGSEGTTMDLFEKGLKTWRKKWGKE